MPAPTNHSSAVKRTSLSPSGSSTRVKKARVRTTVHSKSALVQVAPGEPACPSPPADPLDTAMQLRPSSMSRMALRRSETSCWAKAAWLLRRMSPKVQAGTSQSHPPLSGRRVTPSAVSHKGSQISSRADSSADRLTFTPASISMCPVAWRRAWAVGLSMP